MPDSASTAKRAMDAKLALVWARPAESASPSTEGTVFNSTLSFERIESLQSQQDEAVSRVFRSLAS